MNILRIASPYWLLLFVPLAFLILLRHLQKKKKRGAALLPSLENLKELPLTNADRLRKILPSFPILTSVLFILALARPQYGIQEARLPGEGISIVMCVDRSGSMAAEDFQIDGIPVSRLEAVKKVFREFVEGTEHFRGRPNDLIGLIAFGGFVDTFSPLTLDHTSLLSILETIQTPIPLFDSNGNPVRSEVADEESGTAIGDALAIAVERIKNSPSKTKIIVLLSDGMQTVGMLSPEEGIKVAQAYGIKVYTIGVGSSEPVPFPTYLPTGTPVMTSQVLEFDSTTLETIAASTGGRYFYANDVKKLKEVYSEIDNLERTKFTGETYAEYGDLYRYFAFCGLILIVIYSILTLTRFRAFP